MLLLKCNLKILGFGKFLNTWTQKSRFLNPLLFSEHMQMCFFTFGIKKCLKNNFFYHTLSPISSHILIQTLPSGNSNILSNSLPSIIPNIENDHTKSAPLPPLFPCCVRATITRSNKQRDKAKISHTHKTSEKMSLSSIYTNCVRSQQQTSFVQGGRAKSKYELNCTTN